MQATRQAQSGKADKKAGTRHQRATASILQVLNPAHMPPVDTMKGRQAEPQPAPTFQKYISISPLSVSEIPEKTPKHTKNLFTFAPFCPDSMPFCPCGVMEGAGDAGVNICRLLYSEDATNDTHPPPYLGSKKALYPHNFSHQKSRKKSPWPDWKKISEKICEKMFRGKRKAPNLVERGRGVLKYERIKLGAKIVELFGNASGEFFHFVFVP